MATRLYLRNVNFTAFTPTIRGTWDVTTQTGVSELGTDRSGASTTVAQAVGSTTLPRDVLLQRFVSPAMTAGGTLTGTVEWVMGVLESAAGLDGYFKIHAWISQGSADTVRGTLISNMSFGPSTANGNIAGTEWTTAFTGRGEGAESTGSVACSAGDRIVLEVGYRADGAGATNQTATLRYGGTGADLTQGSTTTTLAPWIEFSGADVLFVPVGTKIETLVDNFDDNSRNVVLWPGNYGTHAETGGKAVVTCDVAYNAYESAHAWQLDESFVFFTPTAPASSTAEVSIVYAHDTVFGTNISYSLINGILRCSSQTDFFDATASDITYDPVNHAWLRIRETANVVYWDASPDGLSWTNLRNIATPTWVRTHTGGLFYFQGYQPSGSSTFTVDNVNVAPSAAAQLGRAFLAFFP